jgi:hypothetical protein
MAGTLWYRLKVDHIYQRRFGDSASLAEALGSSHWYIISRRPSVRIVEESAQFDGEMLTADFITRNNLSSPERLHTLGSDFRHMGSLANFRTYEDGAYFSFNVGDDLMHGDAWALASLLSHADVDIAMQEVLYVGQAFGREGSSNAWERTRKHEKLQRIYEDHVNDECEIFVSPLSLGRGGFINDDHIDDEEYGPSIDGYYGVFVDREDHILKPAVDLIEHAMISYFASPYNDMLTEWRVEKPTEAMQKMRSAGFRLLHVYLSGWWGLARFFSAQEPDGHRSHFISHDFPPSPRESVLRGIAASKLSNWRTGAWLAREGKEIFAGRSELAGVALRVFGDEAPVVRKPPGINLSRSASEFTNDLRSSNAHQELRAAMKDAREAERKENEPRLHSGQSSYDPHTGTIEVGETIDSGEKVRIRLHDPKSNEVDSALILGDPQSGKSNMLRIVILEAFMARRFIVMPSDPGGENNFMKAWSRLINDRLIASDVNGTVANLTLVRQIVNKRLESGYRRDESVVSDIIVPIDDSDALLQDELGARLVIDLLQRGGRVGVGLLLVVSDITKFKDNLDLMYELVSCPAKYVFMPREPNFIADLTAMYGARRQETWRDNTLSFVLHHGVSGMSVGLLMAVVDPDCTLKVAQSWCSQRLTEAGILISEWTPQSREPDSWNAVDHLALKFFSLRHHQDNWALVMNISQSSSPTESKSVDMISWANDVINYRYTVKYDGWQLGPTISHPDAFTLYADIKGDIVANDTEGAINDMLLEMFDPSPEN